MSAAGFAFHYVTTTRGPTRKRVRASCLLPRLRDGSGSNSPLSPRRRPNLSGCTVLGMTAETRADVIAVLDQFLWQFIGCLRVHPELGGLAEIRAQHDRRFGRYAASLVRQRTSSRSIHYRGPLPYWFAWVGW